MAALEAAIQESLARYRSLMDGRVKPGHDD